MPTKRCAWGQCKSDSRYKNAPHMDGVTFWPFPKPKTNLEKCQRWVKLCGRPFDQLNPSLIKRHTHYVCSKHFLNDQPDPQPATPFEKATSSRKRPRDRCSLMSTPKRRLLVSVENVQTTTIMDSSDVAALDLNLPNFDILNDDENCSKGSLEEKCENNVNCEKSIQTEVYNPFIERILSCDKLCFHYTGVPTVELLKWIFEWIEPAAVKTKLWDGERRHIPGRKGGRKRKKTF